jgi:hypothetical protein
MVFWLIGANTPIMKIYFKCISKKIKKLNKKFWVCICTFYVHTSKFWWERTFFVACVKMTKNSYINRNFVEKNLSFLHRSQKLSFFYKTWWVNIKCLDARYEFLFRMFRHFQKMTLDQRVHMLLWAKVDFRDMTAYIIACIFWIVAQNWIYAAPMGLSNE